MKTGNCENHAKAVRIVHDDETPFLVVFEGHSLTTHSLEHHYQKNPVMRALLGRTFVNKVWHSNTRISVVKMMMILKAMPNAKTHFIVGAVTGAVVNATLQLTQGSLKRKETFDWGEFLVSAGTAGAAALLPDLIEPATTPNHRKFFHSVFMAGIVAYLMTGKHTKRLPRTTLLLLTVAGAGYLSHLAADATTPKCISIY